MTTLNCTANYARLILSTEEISERTGATVRAPGDWDRDRLKGARSCSLAILADAAKPALDWAWS